MDVDQEVRPANERPVWNAAALVLVTCGMAISVLAVGWPGPIAECGLRTTLSFEWAGASIDASGERAVRELGAAHASARGLSTGMIVEIERAEKQLRVHLSMTSRSPRRDLRALERCAAGLSGAIPARLADLWLRADRDRRTTLTTQALADVRARADAYAAAVEAAMNHQSLLVARTRLEPTYPVSTRIPPSTPVNPRWLAVSRELDAARGQLADCLEQFTSRHPNVEKARRNIQGLSDALDRIPMVESSSIELGQPFQVGASPTEDDDAEWQPQVELDAWAADRGAAERAEQDLRRSLDAFTTAAAASDTSGPAASLDSPVDAFRLVDTRLPSIVARQGGRSPAQWRMIGLTALAAGFLALGIRQRSRYHILRDLSQLGAWGVPLVAAVGRPAPPSRRHAVADVWGRFARLFLVAVCAAVLIGWIVDPGFAANLVHDPRMALIEAIDGSLDWRR
ncbi:MAG: hypothetical protein FJ297_15310 [Planctomycetes bacterium]|nr:hypothetical protein [Planctomycetota bacterium]